MDMTEQASIARTAQTTEREIEVQLDHIFFSRTDARGVIRSFNADFKKISGYSGSELLNAPHRLVRHDGMPKGLFYQFWKALKAGDPVGAYVKNRTKDGQFYWVFATVLPLDDGGYISVRIKPTSQMFLAIEPIYDELCAAEQASGLTPAQSADLLVDRLRALGHDSYGLFQAQAAYAEISGRAKALGHAIGARLAWLLAMNDATARVRKERQSVLDLLDELQLLPTNMRLISHRIERGNGPLSTLSERYGVMVDSLLKRLAGAVRTDHSHAHPEAEALFRQASSRLFIETAKAFRDQTEIQHGMDRVAEIRLLDHASQDWCRMTGALVEAASVSVIHLSREIDQMRRAILALDSIRVMCRVEFGQMADRSRDLANVIDRIDQCHRKMNDHLDRLAAASRMIEDAAESLLSNV